MKAFFPRKPIVRSAVLALAVITAAGGLTSMLWSAEPKPGDKPDDSKPAASASKPVKKKLTGAELYSIHCNRCHAERYPTEWTSAQWKTLMTHMRVRANLPAKQAKEILKYLQEESGN